MIAKLAGSAELVRLLLNSTGEGIYGVDLDGNFTFANPACARLLGYESVDEILGRHMHVWRRKFSGAVRHVFLSIRRDRQHARSR